MASPLPVLIPLLNPNETEALLAGLHVHEGQAVHHGDRLATLETTKAAGDVLAEADGYVTGLRLAEGQTARAGEVLCYLAESPGADIPLAQPDRPGSAPGDGQPLLPHTADIQLPPGLRISRPALALAQKSGLDLKHLPIGPLVTEGEVQKLLGRAVAARLDPTAFPRFDPANLGTGTLPLVIYGGGGHGKSLIELIRCLSHFEVVGVVDDGLAAGEAILGVPVLGGGEVLPGLFAGGVRLAVNAVGGIGSLAIRLKVFERLAQAGFASPPVVHPTAFVEASARLGDGAQAFPLAYIGSDVRTGFGCIINTGAIVSHDCRLGDFVNISPGAILAGGVSIGERALVGMGVTLNLEVKVGAGARIGNGATVKQDVPEGGVVRAGKIWPE